MKMTDDNPSMGIKTKACVNGVYPDTIPTINQNISDIQDDIGNIQDNVGYIENQLEDCVIKEVTSDGTQAEISDGNCIVSNSTGIGFLKSNSVLGIIEQNSSNIPYATPFLPEDDNENPVAPPNETIITSANLDVDPRITSLASKDYVDEKTNDSWVNVSPVEIYDTTNHVFTKKCKIVIKFSDNSLGVNFIRNFYFDEGDNYTDIALNEPYIVYTTSTKRISFTCIRFDGIFNTTDYTTNLIHLEINLSDNSITNSRYEKVFKKNDTTAYNYIMFYKQE